MRRLRPRKSMTVNAVSLMTATLATNALGLVFWTEAARLGPPSMVGRAAAVVAALTLLASISQLNLTNVFMRLLPTAGRLGRRLVVRGYLAVVALALIVATVYMVSGLGASVVTGPWPARALFAVAVAVLAIFALQDSVLTALRLAPWVAVENISFAVGKLVLLPALVASVGSGIAVSWVLPATAAVIAVTVLLFVRALPALRQVEGTLPERRRLLSFVAGEYTGNIFATASVQLMPLLVVWRLGPAQAAYFTLPWLIAMGITVLLWNVASSFVVEIAGGHDSAEALVRRTVILWGVVVLGTVLVCTLGAHVLLAVAGQRYSTHGTELLRMIGLSAPASAVVAVYATLAWLDQRVWLLAGFQALSAAVLLGSTLLLLPQLGLVAVGWANLGTQTLAALIVAPLVVSRLRRGEFVEASP